MFPDVPDCRRQNLRFPLDFLTDFPNLGFSPVSDSMENLGIDSKQIEYHKKKKIAIRRKWDYRFCSVISITQLHLCMVTSR